MSAETVTLLYVEDNQDNAFMIRKRFGRKGYAVELAENGAVGVEKAKALRPDLILMDISMPVMDGLEATRLIKQDPATADIPVIALTAHAMDQDRMKAITVGADGFEAKPVDFPKLSALVATLIAERRAD